MIFYRAKLLIYVTLFSSLLGCDRLTGFVIEGVESSGKIVGNFKDWVLYDLTVSDELKLAQKKCVDEFNNNGFSVLRRFDVSVRGINDYYFSGSVYPSSYANDRSGVPVTVLM